MVGEFPEENGSFFNGKMRQFDGKTGHFDGKLANFGDF